MSTRAVGPAAAIIFVMVASIVLPAQATGEGQARAVRTAAEGTAAEGSGLRTSWGDPDLQGVWDYRTITPLERPRELADQAFFSADEIAQREARAAARLDEVPDGEPTGGITVHAPYWTDPGRFLLEGGRTSLIVDPSDGRVPPMTAEAAAGNRGGGGGFGTRADSWEDRSMMERCITQGLPRAIMPTLYNNNIHIVQAPGTVAIVHEMIHEARVIPLDGRAHLNAGLRPIIGDSRGRWEGETLVVETTNFSEDSNFRGATRNLRLVERFTRLDAATLGYELTIDDPTVWTQPWTVAYPMRPSEGPIYEYACHEGNYGLRNILEVARDEEKAAAAAR